ncbi:SPOR domain-containing protein [Chitinophagaceae bacterium 26-R-25]|nr:SPOR domain-containing protein [Chitinophagaceae bacterium 26-R-25]
MKLAFVMFMICTVFYANAQNTTSVAVKKDPRIDMLIKKQMQINEATTRASRSSAQGFRIQVINTSDRNKAIAVKTKVYELYPDLKAYLLYQAPYFRLRVGNFKTQDEAMAYQKKLAKQFDNTIVVRDIIEVKPDTLDDSN